jgi:precorrin-6B methylase 2
VVPRPEPLRRSSRFGVIIFLLVTAAGLDPSWAGQAGIDGPLRLPDVPYIPTPPEVVVAMLKVAKVGPGDVVYDLGSGDGRIAISAVRDFHAARAVGIDIDPRLIRTAEENAKVAGVADRVQFFNRDLFETDIGEASVVTLYLLQALNIKLIPKLKSELKASTRVVSHSFDMGSAWPPEQKLIVNARLVYFWTLPGR